MNHVEPIHLRPTATLAERVLLPGDPGRALTLAQLLLSDPLMFNHHRGLWGYTGTAADGEPLTVQSTGMGGPSAAIVLRELISLGARRAIRVGTCGALDPTLGLGDLVVAREAIAAEGTTAALMGATLSGDTRARAHAGLTDRLNHALSPNADDPTRPESEDAGTAPGVSRTRRAHPDATIVSTDLFYEEDSRRGHAWLVAGAIAVEMEASALFTVGERAGIEVACVLAVSDRFDERGARIRIDDQTLVGAVEAMGTAAATALAA